MSSNVPGSAYGFGRFDGSRFGHTARFSGLNGFAVRR